MGMKLKNNQAGVANLAVLLIVVILVVIGFVGWKVGDNSNSKRDNQTVANTTKANSNLSETDKTKTEEISKQVTIVIEELGISFSGPETLSDLTYSPRTSTTDDGKKMLIADFSSKSLTAFDSGCAASESAPPLGNIAKITGLSPQDPTATNSASPLIKQFSNFYIEGSLGTQAMCTNKPYTAELENKTTTLRKDLKQALKSVKEL